MLCGDKDTAFLIRQLWAGILALLLASFMSLCRFPDFSGLQFLLDLVGCSRYLVTLQHLEGLEKQYLT